MKQPHEALDDNLNSFIAWLATRLVSEDHDCLLGVCPHDHQSDCIDAIKEAYYEDSGVF